MIETCHLKNLMIFIQTIFKVILNISEIKPSGQIHNPTIRIYIKKIGNKITLKIKKITAETMDLFESIKKNKNKSENGKNVPHLEITEVVLVYCNIVNNDYQLDSRILYTFVLSKSFGHLLNFLLKNFIF